MLKLILVSILLTIVYSWEETKWTILTLIRGTTKHDPGRYYAQRLDQMVSTLILLATIPIGLTWLLASGGSLLERLGWLALYLFIISYLATGAGIALRRMRIVRATPGAEKIIPIAYTVMGLFSPMIHSLGNFGSLPRSVMARLAFWLALPPAIGFLIRSLNDSTVTTTELLPNLDALTILLVGALIIRICVEFLEHFFRLYRLEKLFSYFRIILGIGLVATLLAGLV